MRRDSFKATFFTKKNQLLKNGQAPVMLRITVNGLRVQVHTKHSINPDLWSQAKECSRARDAKSRELNDYIEASKARLRDIFLRLEQDGKLVTAEIVKNRFFGLDDNNRKTLVGFFREHNEQSRALIGIDYVDITVRRYECCARYLEEFIREKYGQDDLLLREINGEFVRGFEFFMKTAKRCQQNTVIRYMKCFKKIVNLAIANEWITRNPFSGIKFHEVPVNKEFLTMDEINTMMNKQFSIKRLEIVRDVFCFCAMTGMAFIDVYNLRREHIVKDNDGNWWIRKAREKTKNMCNIPLLSVARQILDKYADDPHCLAKGVLLPVMCNQKMNAYLKEIGDLCGITKKLTTHVARYTAATVVFLANNVSMENVAKILGHSNIKMTQHYAKVLDSSIMRDMAGVERCFANSMNCVETRI